jgi:hypothetical protein
VGTEQSSLIVGDKKREDFIDLRSEAEGRNKTETFFQGVWFGLQGE